MSIQDAAPSSPSALRDLLSKWLQVAGSGTNLSVEQHRVWLLHTLNPANLPPVLAAYSLAGALDPVRLKQSLDAVAGRNDLLTTRIVDMAGKPLRIPGCPIPALEIVDLSGVPDDRCRQEVVRLVHDLAGRTFDIAAAPGWRATLVKTAQAAHVLLVAMHRIIAADDTPDILIRDLRARYGAGSGPAPEGEAAPPAFSNFVERQRAHLDSAAAEDSLRFWRGALAGSPVLSLPSAHQRPPVLTHDAFSRVRHLDGGSLARLRSLGQDGGDPSLPYLTAYRIGLAWASGRNDLAVGMEVRLPEWRSTAGPCSTMVALRTVIDPDHSFAMVLRDTASVLRNALAHAAVPFGHVVKDLQPQRDLSRTPLFQASFRHECRESPAETGGITWTRFPVDTGRSLFELEFHVVEEEAAATLTLRANRSIYDSGTIDRLLDHILVLLDRMAAQPEAAVRPTSADGEPVHPALPAEMGRQDSRCIHHLVEEQAARTPDADALVYGQQALSYQELNRQANRMAHFLIRHGIGPEVRVGLFAHPSPEFVIAMLAVLKAGGAYIPIDPGQPDERVRLLVARTDLRLILACPGLSGRLPDIAAARAVEIGNPELVRDEPHSNPACPVAPANLAYIIHTSGSTGQPKGVMLTHRGVVSNLIWRQDIWPLGQRDRVLQHYSFSFDPSVWATFWPLMSGAAIVLPPSRERFDATLFVQDIIDHRVTVYGATPSMHGALVETAGIGRASALRLVLSGGEQLTSALQKLIETRTGARVANLYGPTEATIDATVWEGEVEPTSSIVPIGRPLPFARVLVLDGSLRPVPAGVIGEICIGGPGLARGYAGYPALTAERFVPDPFVAEPGARLYRTGDLGRVRPDGAIEFVGREDGQIKVRGYRVELGEIEHHLAAHPQVRSAAVIARSDGQGSSRLVAFVAPAGPDSGDLADFLRLRLPDYMVPAEIAVLDRLPHTPNGKIDRKALAERKPEAGTRSETAIPPRTPMEREIAAAVQAILSVDGIGVLDNFFDHGGDSITAARLASRLSNDYDLDLPVQEIFQEPTVESIAALVEGLRSGGAATGATPWTVERLQAEVRPALDLMPGAPPGDHCWTDPEHIFITGATGYLGAVLIDALARRTNATLHCLVRATGPNQAQERVESTLRFFRCWNDGLRDRLNAVPGDLGKPELGLPPRDFQALAERIDVIYHSGALVNFVYPYSVLKAPNVLATGDILRLACTGRLKAVHYVSTIDTLLGTRVPRPYREDDLAYRVPVRVPDGYPRSKWVAEMLVSAAGERGVPVTVYRPGLIMGHTRTGATQTNNYLVVGLKGYLELGILPEDENLFDIIPVDYAADAIAHLSLQRGSIGKTFHLWHHNPIPTMQTYDWVRSFGYRVETVSREVARKRVLTVGPDNPLYPFVPHFQRENPATAEKSMFHPDIMKDVDSRLECRNTDAGLAGSGIACPEISEALVHKCFEFLVESDFLPSPPAVSAATGRPGAIA
ncbi:aminoadipate-semialdehyde dehydrogenase large subunit (plasmid) [Azospirillum sp. B510]|uniref:non-ribosomal peptide synthetase n=1 Tax=Azospirillum sp. (strain B510) TaxID=137722 RepID=UPI0001C4CF5F|nr:non-ribosomal peptide synthetase [Azospirillum sp. B510]BAI76833.1 aminoadipate-semialdehyde dehydrogenase large subunit [Azospirillum sp. B510]